MERSRSSGTAGGPGLVAGLLLLVLAAGAVGAESLPPVAARSPWSVERRSEEPGAGWVIYKRSLPGSDFEAFRLEAEIDAPPERVAEALRANIRDPEVSQRHTKKTVLRDEGDVVLVYSYIEMPLVSDRDVVTRSERATSPEDEIQRFEWHATDEGPAPRDGVVRLEKSSGSWEFRPLPGNRTFAVYESHTEIGGSIPAWLVNRLMLDTVVDGLDSLRARLEQQRPRIASDESTSGPRPR